MTIKNSVPNDFLPMFIDSIYLLNCHLPGVLKSYVHKLLSPPLPPINQKIKGVFTIYLLIFLLKNVLNEV